MNLYEIYNSRSTEILSDIDKTFNDIDLNNDGWIDFDDFQKYMLISNHEQLE